MFAESREKKDLEEESHEVLIEEERTIEQQVWYVVNEVAGEQKATSVDKLVPRFWKKNSRSLILTYLDDILLE